MCYPRRHSRDVIPLFFITACLSMSCAQTGRQNITFPRPEHRMLVARQPEPPCHSWLYIAQACVQHSFFPSRHLSWGQQPPQYRSQQDSLIPYNLVSSSLWGHSKRCIPTRLPTHVVLSSSPFQLPSKHHCNLVHPHLAQPHSISRPSHRS